MDGNLTEIIREKASAFDPEPTGVAPRGESLSGIHAVVFDVYGTLIASGVGDISLAQAHPRDTAIRTAIEESGFNLEPEAASLGDLFHRAIRDLQDKRRNDGIEFPEVEIREVWDRLIGDLCGREILDGEVTHSRIEEVAVRFEMTVNPVWPMPDLQQVLGQITARGLPLGIVSNAQFFTPLLFEALCGKDIESLGFDPACCVWSYLKREAKP